MTTLKKHGIFRILSPLHSHQKHVCQAQINQQNTISLNEHSNFSNVFALFQVFHHYQSLQQIYIYKFVKMSFFGKNFNIFLEQLEKHFDRQKLF
jgi:hypothetical protein